MTARTFSHAALNVGRGDGPLAMRLLQRMGFEVHDNGPSGRGEKHAKPDSNDHLAIAYRNFEARLDASPVFSDAQRVRYLSNGRAGVRVD